MRTRLCVRSRSTVRVSASPSESLSLASCSATPPTTAPMQCRLAVSNTTAWTARASGLPLRT
ncbi:DUF2826 domain-containing protein [Sinorhizobium meliloti]|nr:DUF2826 domain-containing protein [Sinorhizobium meliloti]MDW9807199.1 DUF2826 domain-containing protein [Sinorhizobium meliloti]MDX0278292.1 DUF2826 domain-containing protein [Sinorhizobium meliloti]MQX61558.1 DUF2826 domain-containing protein [Sinorhizobium meliloti]RVG48838.1 DUF2826 domain-containing protein [Sinorhizobium meliloti]